MREQKLSDKPKWGCCGGYHESFEETCMVREGVDLRRLSDENLREMAATETELPIRDLSREELLCILSRRKPHNAMHGKLILL